MCTVSWLQHEDGYELLFNRDERKTRPVAHPPRLQTSRGVRFIAPTDALHGGTWLAVNEFGLTFCLLNRYDQAAHIASPTSRGQIILRLIDCRSGACAAERLAALSLAEFQPFTLAVVAANNPVAIFTWNGVALKQGETAQPFLTSSSFDTKNVIAQRQSYFAACLNTRGRISSEALSQLHASHAPLPLAAAICMHRGESQTVSFSRLSVSPTAIEFSYSPQAPCSIIAAETQSLTLSRAIA